MKIYCFLPHDSHQKPQALDSIKALFDKNGLETEIEVTYGWDIIKCTEGEKTPCVIVAIHPNEMTKFMEKQTVDWFEQKGYLKLSENDYFKELTDKRDVFADVTYLKTGPIGCLNFVAKGAVLFLFSGGKITDKASIKEDFFQLSLVENKHYFWFDGNDKEMSTSFHYEAFIRQWKEKKTAYLGDFFINTEGYHSIFASLLSIDILLQGFLTIHSKKWEDIRNLPGVLVQKKSVENAGKATELKNLFQNSSRENGYWFDCFVSYYQIKNLLAFTQQADVLLSQSPVRRLSKKNQARFQNRFFSVESALKAEKIANISNKRKEKTEIEDQIKKIDGGAIRLCWELIIGHGTAYGWCVVNPGDFNEDEITNLLCLIFEKAHEEYQDCLQLINEKIPERWI